MSLWRVGRILIHPGCGLCAAVRAPRVRLQESSCPCGRPGGGPLALGVARGSRCWEGGAGQTLSSAVGDIIGVAMPGSCLLAGDVPVTVGANRGHE
jgi:hypothetical protein